MGTASKCAELHLSLPLALSWRSWSVCICLCWAFIHPSIHHGNWSSSLLGASSVPSKDHSQGPMPKKIGATQIPLLERNASACTPTTVDCPSSGPNQSVSSVHGRWEMGQGEDGRWQGGGPRLLLWFSQLSGWIPGRCLGRGLPNSANWVEGALFFPWVPLVSQALLFVAAPLCHPGNLEK